MDLIKRGERRRANSIHSTKYYLDCQSKVAGNKNTREWLIVKNILLDSKVILGLLNQNMQVVIKIGDRQHIDREYAINKQLQQYRGFTRYICEFNCRDKLNKYIPKDFNGNILYSYRDTGFCENDGDVQTYSIIMPYYPLGNMMNYHWNESNFGLFKNIIKDIIAILLYVNNEIGFLHNDLHLENIMVKSKNDHVTFDLIDFELSTINVDDKNNLKKLGQNFRKLFNDIGRLDYIDYKSIYELILLTDSMRDPFEKVDLNDLSRLIDSMSFISRN